jgi:hypothetical protein
VLTLLTSGSTVSRSLPSGWEGRKRIRCGGGDPRNQAGGRVDGDQPAGVEQRQAVAEPLGLLHEVRDQHHGHAPVADALDEVPGVTTRVRVQPGGQLVQDGDLRVADQRQRDRQPLLLAAGELGEPGVTLVGQPQVLQQRPPVGRVLVEGAVEVERLPDLHLLGKLAFLELCPDALPELVAVASRVEPEHRHPAGVGDAEALDRLDGGGLARPVGAEDAEDLAPLDGKRDVMHRDAVAVSLVEVLDLDDRHACRPPRSGVGYQIEDALASAPADRPVGSVMVDA